jgi:maltooligosyltrehalose synthase
MGEDSCMQMGRRNAIGKGTMQQLCQSLMAKAVEDARRDACRSAAALSKFLTTRNGRRAKIQPSL